MTNAPSLSRLVLICLCMLGLQPPAFAQAPYTRLTVEDGLSNNSVQCILQDKHGIMWIGTNSGLNRYDGTLFMQYHLLSNPALSNNMITALLEDDAGNIWIGTENGINILDPVNNTVRQFVHSKNVQGAIPHGPVRGIQKMKDGSIWVISENWFAKYGPSHSFSTIAMEPLWTEDHRVFAGITETDADQLWVSYIDHPALLAQKYHLANGRDSIAALDIKWPDYSRVYIDVGRTTWGITHKGVTRFNSHTRHYEPWLVNKAADSLNTLHVHTSYSADAHGAIWQGSQALNLAQFDLKQRKVTNYNWLLQTCKATMVYCLYTDRSNTVWIGTDNGIIKLSNRSSFFKNLPFTMQGKEITNIRCRKIIEDKYGSLYAGTESHGLLKLMPNAGGGYTTVPLSIYGAVPVSDLPLTGNTIRVPDKGIYDIGFMYDMWYDNNNTIWLSGYGLLQYDIPTGHMTIYVAEDDKETKSTDYITQLSICHADSLIWTGGLHNLYTLNMATRRLVPFRDNKGIMPFHQLPCWSLAKKGKWIWVGSDKGLYKINAVTKEVHKEITHAALQLTINDIFIDIDSSFWISTAGGGVLHYRTETGQLTQYTTRDGLSNNTVCGTLADAQHNLWISTYAGLNYLNRQTKQFASFYAKDGLNGDEFNRKAFTRLRNGDLIFGGLNGYNVFNVNNTFTGYQPAGLLLTSFSKTTTAGKVMETIFGTGETQPTVIDPGDKFYAFNFTLTDMYDPASNRYSWKLEGFDDNWHYIGNQHTVSFLSLPAGTYTLRIKGFSAKYLVAKNELAIPIVVKQAFYKSPWFIAAIVLAALAIVSAIWRNRIRQLKKMQTLRTRIASDLHDEVGSNLVRITMLADAGKRSNSPGTMHEQLGLIAGISRDAGSIIRDVIWNIDARNDTMEDMVNYMHEHIHNMLTPAGIEFSFQHPGVPGDRKPDINFRQNVYLIFKEAINNIVKHSGANYVQVTLEQKPGLFMMTVKDNGRGLVEKGQTGKQGLYNMQMRAARINATLTLIPKEGLTVLLEVPV